MNPLFFTNEGSDDGHHQNLSILTLKESHFCDGLTRTKFVLLRLYTDLAFNTHTMLVVCKAFG